MSNSAHAQDHQTGAKKKEFAKQIPLKQCSGLTGAYSLGPSAGAGSAMVGAGARRSWAVSSTS